MRTHISSPYFIISHAIFNFGFITFTHQKCKQYFPRATPEAKYVFSIFIGKINTLTKYFGNTRSGVVIASSTPLPIMLILNSALNS